MVFPISKRYDLVFAVLLIAGAVLVLPAGAAVTISPSGGDDTDAIRIGISDAALEPDRTLILNPGTYNVTSRITVSESVTIRADTGSGHGPSDTVIDGMGTQNGNGILAISSGTTVVLDNLTFFNGTATNGGAVYLDGGSSLEVTGTTFDTCTATDTGGAIHAGSTTTVIIDQSTFIHCTATNSGGAIETFWSTVITNSAFTSCSAGNGGAILNRGSGALAITSSTFKGCTAANGGAIYFEISSGLSSIMSSTFTGCSAVNDGGAIMNHVGNLQDLHFNRFTGNTAAPHGGSAIFNQGNIGSATNNWWGTNSTPSGQFGGLGFSYTPWLVLSATADPPTITPAETSTIRANLTCDSAGVCHDPLLGHVPEAIPGTWDVTPVGGRFSPDAAFLHDGEDSTVFTPPAAAGTSIITITIDGQPVFVPVTVAYARPAVTGLSLTGGRVTGGEMVTITGTNFNGTGHIGANAVMFGTTPAFTYHEDSDTQITAVAPNHAIGTVHVTVTTPGGTSATTVNDEYTYTNVPVVTSVTPSSGPTGGTLVTIRGMGFEGTTDVMFGSVPPAGYIIDNDMQITAIYLNGTAGTTVDIRVTTPEGTSAITPDDQFTYYAQVPAILQVYPASGPVTGGTVVGIMSSTHDGLGDTSSVMFGPNPATIIGREPGFLTVVSPPHPAGTVDIIITTPGGTSAITPADRFTYEIAPTPAPAPISTQQDNSETLSDFPNFPTNPVMTVTVNIGGNSKAWQAIVTGTGLKNLIVTGTLQNGGNNATAPPPGTVFQFINLEPARYDSITKAVISFTVPQSWLDENDIDPKSIVLYHYTANGWVALPTTVLYTKDGTVYFSAESPGFSLFAIAGTPAATMPAVAVKESQAILTENVQALAPAAVAKAPVATQTTAPAAPAPVPTSSSPFPVVPVLAVLCCTGIIGGGWYVRRWWIRRQNPVLFAEYD